jgi:transaldolase
MPLNTYEKFKKMGKPGATITKDMNQAKAHLNALTQSGIILKNITDQLLEDGVKKFTDSYHDVLTTIREKKEKIAAG